MFLTSDPRSEAEGNVPAPSGPLLCAGTALCLRTAGPVGPWLEGSEGALEIEIINDIRVCKELLTPTAS